jgi:hypothetical protein
VRGRWAAGGAGVGPGRCLAGKAPGPVGRRAGPRGPARGCLMIGHRQALNVTASWYRAARLGFSASGRRDPPVPGLVIEPRFVSRVLVFERMVSLTAQAFIGFGAHDVLQRRDRAGIAWLGAPPQHCNGLGSHMLVRILQRHLDEQADQIPGQRCRLALLAGR